jgi:hypothetical protein
MATATKQTAKSGAKQGATVRISEQSHHWLRELAAQSGEPMQAVLDKALEQYRRQRFLEECHAAYCVLQQDPVVWADYQQELAAWDVTLLDGLEPENNLSAEEGKHG